jgi:hypothetical protein
MMHSEPCVAVFAFLSSGVVNKVYNK